MNRMLGKVLTIVALVGALSSAHAALPFFNDDKEVPSLAPMLEEVTPAVVSISVAGTQVSRQRVPEMFRFFFGPNAPQEQLQERPFRGLGSGVIIDAKQGYVVTNNHVVDQADEITVKLTDGRELEAKKIGSDEQSDIALLQIKAENLSAVKLADSDKLRVGDFVVAIGNPFGLTQTVTSGIVSALGRSDLNIVGNGGYEDFIQTDAAINRGNSGGALVNLRGELVGINTAIYGPNGGNVGIGFAIPVNMMKHLTDQLIEFGEIRRGLLGILGGDLDAELAKAMELDISQGAFVREVNAGSAAEKGGILPGDIIVSIDGKEIRSFTELRAKIGTMGAGTKVKLDIIRDGKRQKIDVVLDDYRSENLTAQQIHPFLEGATLSDGPNQQGTQGVVVSEVIPRSPAARLGLQDGDVIVGVNRQPIKNVGELSDILRDNQGVIALNIKRGNTSLYLVIR
ncbi:DegQ family serine endoprotease [Aliiglaciecola sp. CAU 1673]|uniref:DegQ family serine endoprotease n=1 Tax=Aliiglaciecola sp. CAU 1673 TaxID=3032595 RepID=UPI0023DAC3E7|nr:DegQ family serine endoprotease [Aliiglaciecola sp. CAU 1673]MDF2178462.1 DegQ family serine endoprotease [Aliiglaciecola sp. CAU 1673]